MSASSVSESCRIVASSTSARRESAESRRFERAPLRARTSSRLSRFASRPSQVGAPQDVGVAGAQVDDGVAQDVEQLAVVAGLAVAEELAADGVDAHRHAGADLAQDAGDERVQPRLVAQVVVAEPWRYGGVEVSLPAKM